jgi:hypothetical protein
MKKIIIGFGLLLFGAFAHAQTSSNFPGDNDSKDSIIKVAYIDPFEKAAADKNVEPEWPVLEGQISAKYDTATAARLSTFAKVYYYFNKKDYPHFTAALVEYTNKYVGPDELVRLSKDAYFIFLYSTNHDELEAALGWAKHVLDKDPDNEGNQQTYQHLTDKLAGQ